MWSFLKFPKCVHLSKSLLKAELVTVSFQGQHFCYLPSWTLHRERHIPVTHTGTVYLKNTMHYIIWPQEQTRITTDGFNASNITNTVSIVLVQLSGITLLTCISPRRTRTVFALGSGSRLTSHLIKTTSELLQYVIIPVPRWLCLTSNFFFSSVLNCWKRWLGLTAIFETSKSSVTTASPPLTSASQWLALTAWQEEITRVTLLSADTSATAGERQTRWSIKTSESNCGGISLQYNQIHQSLQVICLTGIEQLSWLHPRRALPSDLASLPLHVLIFLIITACRDVALAARSCNHTQRRIEENLYSTWLMKCCSGAAAGSLQSLLLSYNPAVIQPMDCLSSELWKHWRDELHMKEIFYCCGLPSCFLFTMDLWIWVNGEYSHVLYLRHEALQASHPGLKMVISVSMDSIVTHFINNRCGISM